MAAQWLENCLTLVQDSYLLLDKFLHILLQLHENKTIIGNFAGNMLGGIVCSPEVINSKVDLGTMVTLLHSDMDVTSLESQNIFFCLQGYGGKHHRAHIAGSLVQLGSPVLKVIRIETSIKFLNMGKIPQKFGIVKLQICQLNTNLMCSLDDGSRIELENTHNQRRHKDTKSTSMTLFISQGKKNTS